MFAMAALFALFAPSEYLSKGGRDWGNVFAGIKAMFGEFVARYFVSLPFLIFGFLSLRDALGLDRQSKTASDSHKPR